MWKTWRQRLKSALFGMVIGALIPAMALAQTATLLPNAKQQYLDDSGNPVASGSVGYYIPSTSTLKTVWQDGNKTTPQTNPVPLDAAGRPQPAGQTYGDGCYRQVVKDSDSITVWDATTCSTGTSGGTAPAYSEGVMVGTILPWANTTLPSKYLYTAGQEVDRTTYSELLTAITYSTVILCTSGIATITVSTTISDSVPIGAPLEASCFAPGTTVASKASGSLTMSGNATATASVTARILPWGNGNGSTTFNVPDLRGRVLAGRNNMLGSAATTLTSTYYTTPGGTAVNPNAINAVAGSQSQTLITANLPPYTPAGTITNGAITNTVTGGIYGSPSLGLNYAGGGTQGNVGALIVVTSAQAASTFAGTAQGGTSTAFRTVQPTTTSDYIIKALPDDTPGGTGVTSIQGMTGAIFCGANVTCTANTISIVSIPASILSGTVPVAQGGTGLSSGTSGGVPYFNSASTMASSALLTANAFMIGGGAGGSPTTVAITGLVLGNGASTPTAYGGATCTNQFVRALNASGAATCNTVSLTADVTGTLPVGNGGTGATTITSMMDTAFSSTQGSVLYRNASAWVALGPGTSGQLLSSGGPAANPSWITASGTGTVTSVAAGGGLSASPSPITGSGTLSLRTPTVQVLTSGTGATYTTPAGVAYIHVRGCGGGGGGGTTAGGTGGTTSFSASTMSATGGAGSSGTGGTAAAGGTGTNGQINYTGGAGMGTVTTTGAMFMPIMPGGASFMFPATASTPGANTCTGAPTAQTATAGANTGGSGGGGGGFERVIGSPAATYTYTIGAGGTAGTGGAAGGSGVIIVWEY